MKIDNIINDTYINHLLFFTTNGLIDVRINLSSAKDRGDILTVITTLRRVANEINMAADKLFIGINEV